MLFDQSRRFSQVLRSIETSGKPWAAAINGLALGGGFEITLCCHYRVAAENPKTRLGLPEVKVGLFPGAGGTQRVPRLVPPQDAMTILLKGDPVTVEKAKALNLIHAIVPAADLIKAAKDWIKGGGKAVAPWDEKGFKLPGGPVFSKAGMQLSDHGILSVPRGVWVEIEDVIIGDAVIDRALCQHVPHGLREAPRNQPRIRQREAMEFIDDRGIDRIFQRQREKARLVHRVAHTSSRASYWARAVFEASARQRRRRNGSTIARFAFDRRISTIG